MPADVRAGGQGAPLAAIYHQALLRYVGCNADSHLLSAAFGDEISLRRDLGKIDIGNRALKAIKLVRDGDVLRVDDYDVIEHETVLSNSGDNREALVISPAYPEAISP